MMLYEVPNGEKFSGSALLCVLGKLLHTPGATVSEICRATGYSKVTVGRILKFLEAKRLAAGSEGGGAARGRRAARYSVGRRVAAIVCDTLAGESASCVVSLATGRVTSISPKIKVCRDNADKDELLKSDCLAHALSMVSKERLVAVVILSKGGKDDRRAADVASCLPDEYRRCVSIISEEDALAYFFKGERVTAFVFADGARAWAAVIAGGAVLHYEEFAASPPQGGALPDDVAKRAAYYKPERIVIYSPALSSAERLSALETFRLLTGCKPYFTDKFDIRLAALGASLERLTGDAPRYCIQEDLI